MCVRRATLLRVRNGWRVAHVGIIESMGVGLWMAAPCEAPLCLWGCGWLWVTF